MMSSRFHFLDNALTNATNNARDVPMAAADFGAESGSYFLKSTADSPSLTNYPEYKLETDPRATLPNGPNGSNEQKHQTRRRRPLAPGRKRVSRITAVGAQSAAESAVESAGGANGAEGEDGGESGVCQAAVRWETLPGCLVETVLGVTQDVAQKLWNRAPAANGEGSWTNIFTKDNRLTYLSILTFLLFLVYRIFR